MSFPLSRHTLLRDLAIVLGIKFVLIIFAYVFLVGKHSPLNPASVAKRIFNS